MEKKHLIEEINKLKDKRKAIILAHLYQVDEVQEIADYSGDSLELSKKAAETEAQIIVFCGVKFMAETAKILSPAKTVLLPALDAGCPMAEMVEREDVIKLKENNPHAAVVCYVNSSAEVKAVSDYCCTSANAIRLVKNIPEEEIIFIPDRNLGSYVAKHVPEKKMILWDGFCNTHHRIMEQDIEKIKELNLDVPILVHPECKPEVLAKADFVGSTSQILKYARESLSQNLVVGTEMGILYRLKKENPDKNIYLLSPKLVCSNMKKTRLEDIYNVLDTLENQIEVDAEVRRKALLALNRMLDFC
ncbi:quinolinate synthase NadA [Thermanaerosceptrum fracticalcis]|uniref:Quinolinate synthase n=1 Tax=Thermanaerosceptrum fracticalcis TaxID=1712410 RepID=A0A7G6E377_THEFR|nr:quinolinate synthase NadA [Thermanaerosceptrum fracticalcis]QNB46531.1 quinolinate synthase NadA [Thermanaerosceptrum fracticalcis]